MVRVASCNAAVAVLPAARMRSGARATNSLACLVRLHARQLLGEPTAHLWTGIAAHERLEAKPCAQLVPQRLTAAVIDPSVELRRREAEGNVAKVRERGGAAGPGDF